MAMLPRRPALFLVAALVLLVAPAAAQAKAPLYSVGLKATVKKTITSVIPTTSTPADCLGSGEAIESGFISGGISAKPGKEPAAFDGGDLEFGGKFVNLKGEDRTDYKGGFVVDPASGETEASAHCAEQYPLTPFAKKCKSFSSEATSNGSPFTLKSVKGKLAIRFDGGEVGIDCNADSLGGTLLFYAVPTSLALGVVKGLGVGGSAAASGKSVVKTGPTGFSKFTTQTTLSYKLKVSRVK
jgi:hypothetical protein